MRRLPHSVAPLACALAALAAMAVVGPAAAESALLLPRPQHFGEIPAQTFDTEGHRVGAALLRIGQLPNGDVELVSESRIDGGPANRLVAELAPAGDGVHLRPLREESHTDLSAGHGLGFLRIDHAARVVRCTSAEGESTELPMPDGDRVALAPMNLLFLPLVRGETREVDFQIALCRGGPRLVDAKATLAPPAMDADPGRRLVEVRYELDFGPVLSALAKPFLPHVALWFDRAAAGDWMAYRMPLYATGPTVLVVRTGVSPASLGLDP